VRAGREKKLMSGWGKVAVVGHGVKWGWGEAYEKVGRESECGGGGGGV